VAAAALIVYTRSPAIRLLPGLLLALVLPGYAASSALLRGQGESSERVTVAVGLSISITALTGIVLDRTRWGLTDRTWALTLAGITLVGCVGASFSAPTVGRRDVSRRQRPRARSAVVYAAVALLAAVAAAGAVVVAREPAKAAPGDGYTALWIAPRKTAGRFIVGVRSSELRARRYVLVGRARGRAVFRRAFLLSSGEAWTMTDELPRAVLPARLTVRLYLRNRPRKAYRHVSLTLDATRRP
jgi:uncharacterized membrane protein